jgi:hypothetical protein
MRIHIRFAIFCVIWLVEIGNRKFSFFWIILAFYFIVVIRVLRSPLENSVANCE